MWVIALKDGAGTPRGIPKIMGVAYDCNAQFFDKWEREQFGVGDAVLFSSEKEAVDFLRRRREHDHEVFSVFGVFRVSVKMDLSAKEVVV